MIKINVMYTAMQKLSYDKMKMFKRYIINYKSYEMFIALDPNLLQLGVIKIFLQKKVGLCDRCEEATNTQS